MNLKTPLLALALAAAMPAAPALAQQNVLRIGLNEDPDMLDPHRARTFVGRIVFKALCDKFLDITPDLKIVPRLATEWSFADDGMTLTMKLRPNVKFHDGEPFNAEAAKANLDRARSHPESLRRSELASVDSIEAVDGLTIAFKLKRPDATLLAQLTDRASMMMSPKSLGGDIALKPVCSGPYKFVERVQNDRIVLDKFADHWEAGNYSFDRVIYRSIPDGTVRLANLRSGELDLIERLAATDVKSASADRTLRVMNTPGIGYQGITLNHNNGEGANSPFAKDKRVRQAFNLSIDRKVIDDVVFESTHSPNSQPFPPVSPYYRKDVPTTLRDIVKAKALMKEAGIDKLKLELMVSNSPVDMQLGQVIQSMAAEAGFDVQLKASEFASQLRDQQQGKFQLSRVGWSGRIDPDGNIHAFIHSKGGLNDGKYNNAKVDEMLDKARTIYDQAARKQLYDDVQKISDDEAAIIYLYNQPWYFAMRANLQNFAISPDGMIRLQGLKRQ